MTVASQLAPDEDLPQGSEVPQSELNPLVVFDQSCLSVSWWGNAHRLHSFIPVFFKIIAKTSPVFSGRIEGSNDEQRGLWGGPLPVPIPLTTSTAHELGPLCQNVPYQMGLQAGDRLLPHRDLGAPKIPEIQWKAFFMPNGAAKEQPRKCILIDLLSFLVF